jgi:hypothetical protein
MVHMITAQRNKRVKEVISKLQLEGKQEVMS